MRKLTCTILAMLAAVLVGCVTINVYFPEAAAQKAADQFIGTVLDGGGQAAPSAEYWTRMTPASTALPARSMQNCCRTCPSRRTKTARPMSPA